MWCIMGVSRVSGRFGVGYPRVQFWGLCFSSSMSMTWCGEFGFVLFADDTNLFAEGGGPCGAIRKGKQGARQVWQMVTLNLKKTEYIYFSRTRPPKVPQGDLSLRGNRSGG
jgi:hypothetical protein